MITIKPPFPLSRVGIALLSGLALVLLIYWLLGQDLAYAKTSGFFQQEIITAQITELEISEDGLEFLFTSPPPSLEASGRIQVPGLTETTRVPGAPVLPYYKTLVALPPEAEVSISIALEQSTKIRLPSTSHLLKTPSQQINMPDPLISINSGFDTVIVKDEDWLEPASVFPDSIIKTSDPVYIRDLQVVQLSIFPYRYQPDQQLLHYSEQLKIIIQFEGANWIQEQPLSDSRQPIQEAYKESIINYDQIDSMRSFPGDWSPQVTKLPVGNPVFKISVNQDGIYELTQEALATAGMSVGIGGVDPRTFEMLYRGEAVAYQFIGNANNYFESGEKIRFFGWAFKGSRLERQFITDNIYWLWAGGTPTLMETTPSSPGTPVSFVPYSVTFELDNTWFPGFTNLWSLFPNEPDAWFWHLFSTIATPITKTFSLTVDHPLTSSGEALLTAEFSSRDNLGSDNFAHTATITLNNSITSATQSWIGERNLNVDQLVPARVLQHGQNEVTIAASSDTSILINGGCKPCIALNRLTLEYNRLLQVSDDQIIFTDNGNGTRQFPIGGFTSGNLQDLIVWDITQLATPQEIFLQESNITGANPYTLTFGTDHQADSTFIATTAAETLSPVAISEYIPPSLDPPDGGAEWVAITTGDLITETLRLEAHRSDPKFGGLTTFVVDVVDIINQYGYGLPIPSAIQDFLEQGLANWQMPPDYALLVGDATIDPRHIRQDWTYDHKVLTDLVFEDFWQGQIPSDHRFSLLVGEDLAPDIAVGRLSARNVADTAVMIDKIITYEENHLQPFAWMENIVFVSDNQDTAGAFCIESQHTAGFLPSALNPIQLCLDDYSINGSFDADALRQDLITAVNDNGVSLLNYRGHGGVDRWADWPTILSIQNNSEWQNPLRPVVILTGDCLDAHFAYPPVNGLGETLLRAVDGQGNPIGAAAHWGSTGLGFPIDHSVLIEGFYQAVFLNGATAIGDAIKESKVQYSLDPFTDKALLYSFTLQGDPAMQLFRPALDIKHSVEPSMSEPDMAVTYQIQVQNKGVYPSQVAITELLPDGVNFITYTSTVQSSYTISGNSLRFDLQFGDGLQNIGIPRGEIVNLTVEAEISPGIAPGNHPAVATLIGTGLEALPGDESAQAFLKIIKPSVYMPIAIR